MFGCEAFVHVPKEKRKKFDAKAVRCRFLGYDLFNNGYRLEELSTGRVLVSRDVKSNEWKFRLLTRMRTRQTRHIHFLSLELLKQRTVGNTESQEFEDASMDDAKVDNEENDEDMEDASIDGDDEDNNDRSDMPAPRPKRADRSTSLEDMTENRETRDFTKHHDQLPNIRVYQPKRRLGDRRLSSK